MQKQEIAQYSISERLKDGRQVLIRAIRPDDKGRVTETLRAVGPDSFYFRVFSPKRAPSDDELKQITEVDFRNVVALVAVVSDGPKERIVGGGRYIRLGPYASHAEIAFLIDDAHQGLGIGSCIFRHLAAIASASGIDRFEADILPSNQRMLRLFDRSGLPVTRTSTSDGVHVTIELQPAAAGVKPRAA